MCISVYVLVLAVIVSLLVVDRVDSLGLDVSISRRSWDVLMSRLGLERPRLVEMYVNDHAFMM